MNYRKIAYDRVMSAVAGQANILGAGSVEDVPAVKPFVIVSLGVKLAALGGHASHQSLTVYVHDEPGSYVRIDTLLGLIKPALLAPPLPAEGGMVGFEWSFTSDDLWDDFYKTTMKYDTYRLSGKEPS